MVYSILTVTFALACVVCLWFSYVCYKKAERYRVALRIASGTLDVIARDYPTIDVKSIINGVTLEVKYSYGKRD